MKINAPKKPKFYIKNSYASQIMKSQKQNNHNNAFTESSKITINYNINQSVNFNSKKIFFNKKTLYQNCYPNKSDLVKDNFNYTSKNMNFNKSLKKNKGKQNSLGIIADQAMTGRNISQNNYEIINPLKDRSNSENKINCFNRTYTFFNNNNDNNQITYIKATPNMKNKQTKNSVDTISINLTDVSYKNMPTKLHKVSKDNTNISPIKYKKSNNDNKKYFYQEKNFKKNIKEKNNNYSKIQKLRRPMSPQLPYEIDNKSITTPNCNTNSHSTIKIQTSGRIQKYILNNLSDKRKIRSRQCLRQYKDPTSKSTCINKGNLNYEKYVNKKTPDRKRSDNRCIENASILISPSMPSISSNIDDNTSSLKINKKYNVWMKKNKNIKNNHNNNKELGSRNAHKNSNAIQNNKIYNNIIELKNNLSSNENFEGLLSNIDKNEIKGIKETDLFEQSAISIQSAFRGYILKNKFERILYNYKYYNKGYEILEKAINQFYIIEEKKKFLDYLISLKKNNIYKNNCFNCKSCKTFKLAHLHTSPFRDKEVGNTRYYMDLFLHKEIGERFNIIKENKNKEIEEKYKEELNGVNNKMNKLIEENNKLKDINNNIKYKESKFMELSLDNQKKDNIINIITNDNQNLARKLKIIKDKHNKFEIHNQIDLKYISEKTNLNAKELFIGYRNFYLLFLLYKKNISLLNILRRYFNRYKNIINSINSNENINNALREQKLIFLIQNKRNKEYNYLKNTFIKLYYNGLMKHKKKEKIKSVLKAKLKNMIIKKEKENKLIIKSYFSKFYLKGIISHLIEEKNKNIIDKKTQNDNKIRKLFTSMEQRKDKHNFLIKRDCFDKWILSSKILGMKAITDEKKRKKRQKQRMKKKTENKSANKYLVNSNSSNLIHLGKNNINIINKEKEKDKDKEVIISFERSVTTDLSGGEINGENKVKVMKATEKLGDIFYKAALNYKCFEKNKNKTINVDNNINENEKNNKKETIKNNDENDNEEEEDSGDSFGI